MFVASVAVVAGRQPLAEVPVTTGGRDTKFLVILPIQDVGIAIGTVKKCLICMLVMWADLTKQRCIELYACYAFVRKHTDIVPAMCKFTRL